jgi:hypothetical protein
MNSDVSCLGLHNDDILFCPMWCARSDREGQLSGARVS